MQPLTSGKIPKHYFQAVGSGTGGISAWEASLRLKEDGRFGSNLPRLHLAQNLPNAPIYNAWKGKEPEATQPAHVRRCSLQPKTSFRIPGGVKDALEATNGEVYGITDQEASEAKRLFEQSGRDRYSQCASRSSGGAGNRQIEPAQSRQMISYYLNITGGGVSRIKRGFYPIYAAAGYNQSPDGRKQCNFWRADHDTDNEPDDERDNDQTIPTVKQTIHTIMRPLTLTIQGGVDKDGNPDFSIRD